MVHSSDVLDRRAYLKGAGAAGAVALAGCAATPGSGGGEDSGSYSVGIVHFGLDSPLAAVMGQAAEWYAEGTEGIEVTVRDGQRDPSKQLEDANFFLQQGVDAMAMAPFDSDALAKPVEEAAADDIPTMAVNIGVNTEEALGYNAVGQASGGQRTAERMVEALEERYGEPRGRVGILTQVLQYNNVIQRTEGFQQVMDQYDDIEVIQTLQVDPSTQAQAQQTAVNFLQANPDIDGMYYVWGAGGAGLMSALQRVDMWNENGNDDHVIVTGVDGSPRLLDAVNDGFIDYIADQPVHWEYPLALKIIQDYLDAGNDESAITQPGDTVETDYLTVPDQTIDHPDLGELPVWQEPTWGPSEVTTFSEEYPYPYIQEQWTDVTAENATSAIHWENISEGM